MPEKPHICTIRQLASETGIAEYAIRRWAKQGAFRVMRSGKKYLINYDIFIKFLDGEYEHEGHPAERKENKIRPVSEYGFRTQRRF